MDNEQSRMLWNAEAGTFDDEPDHGLRDPHIRQAWTNLLRDSLPAQQTTALDIGCGTGSLSVILAQMGYQVTGIDFAPAMIALAQRKAQTHQLVIDFQVMDGANPDFPAQTFDVIICRHVLWTFPHIDQVLKHWTSLLKPNGRLLLIEGFWFTNAGLHAEEIIQHLPLAMVNIQHKNLSPYTDLWGKVVTDERYLIQCDRSV